MQPANEAFPSPTVALTLVKSLKDHNITLLLLVLIGVTLDAQSYIGGMC